MSDFSYTKEEHIYCLTLFAEKLKGLEYFVFFGTMLGLVRDGEPIEGDDDVDFYVNKKHYRAVIEIAEKAGLTVTYRQEKHFLCVKNPSGKRKFQADFYFYDADANDDYILEYWNFMGIPVSQNVLKTPKALVYPLTVKKFQGKSINLPKEARVLCEYLYGSSWDKPLKKGPQYQMVTYCGQPYMFRKSLFGSIKDIAVFLKLIGYGVISGKPYRKKFKRYGERTPIAYTLGQGIKILMSISFESLKRIRRFFIRIRFNGNEKIIRFMGIYFLNINS